jgi:hypothetical protein
MDDWQCVTVIFLAFLFGYALGAIMTLPRD